MASFSPRVSSKAANDRAGQATKIFTGWREAMMSRLTNYSKDSHPKSLIEAIALFLRA
jgi:hypothetical protein